MLDFNTEPYNDDYDPAKQFYRILYRPSFAVQARELTQMQSILQNQIKTHGDNIFKQGAMVIMRTASEARSIFVFIMRCFSKVNKKTAILEHLYQKKTGNRDGPQA